MMKTIIYLFMNCIALLSNYNYAYTQNFVANKQALQMLKEFYSARSTVKFIVKDSARWDSIQKKYCTQKLIKKAKEWYDDGHDLFTNDWGIDIESLKTMTILKDSTKENTYAVLYIVNFQVSPNKREKKKVTLHVGVVEESENYKITSVN